MGAVEKRATPRSSPLAKKSVRRKGFAYASKKAVFCLCVRLHVLPLNQVHAANTRMQPRHM